MRKMELTPVYQKPSTSKPQPGHKIYPYLLRGVKITEPGHVCCVDISYIPMRRGFLYLVEIMNGLGQPEAELAPVRYPGGGYFVIT
jgi:putative transposase